MSRSGLPDPITPRPKPKVTLSGQLKKLGGSFVAGTGAFRVRMTTRARAGFERIKKRLGLGGTRDDGAGSRDQPTDGDQATPEQKLAQKRDDPDSQHSQEGQVRTKKTFMERVKTGAMGALMMLPLAILLAAIVQGAIDCANIDKAELDITSIDTAAWPEYPDWWPEWAPSPQSDKNKVWISYTPAIHLLMTDTINIKTSNSAGNIQTSITGEHSILNNDDDAMTLIQLADAFDLNEDFSNVVAKFEISTDCMDRMAYAAGQDLEQIVETGSNVFSGFAEALPSFTTIMYVIIAILAVWLFIKGISIARS
jgi:hypothetical protein